MLPAELAKKIRYIEIFTSKAVNDVLAGEYSSAFKGRGMEFDEVREYQPGDDIRTIDWNVTARQGHPYVKRYIEERQLSIMFLVDLSASGAFGSKTRTKNETAAEFAALLAFSAIKNNDNVGLIAFTDDIEMFIPTGKGSSHVLRLIRDILYFRPQGRKTDIARALEYLGRVMHKRCVVFLLSDFFDDDYQKVLRVMAKKHDLIAVSISDPRENQLPDLGLITLEDAESGETICLDSGDATVRRTYAALAEQRQQALTSSFHAMAADHIALSTDEDYVVRLVNFFRSRDRRR